MHHDVGTQFLPFHTPSETKFLPIHTPFETKFQPFHTPKNEHEKNAPPQQKQQEKEKEKANAFLSLICRKKTKENGIIFEV